MNTAVLTESSSAPTRETMMEVVVEHQEETQTQEVVLLKVQELEGEVFPVKDPVNLEEILIEEKQMKELHYKYQKEHKLKI